MTLYSPTARFDTARPLGDDELRRLAPSVFATQAHESRSERFAPIPTIEIVRGLAKEGFHVVGARQAVTRSPDRREFTKHLLRLRRLDNAVAHRVQDTVCEVLLKNANDGTCQYELFAGLFRILCLNSLVAPVGDIDSLKVRHSGDVETKVIEGTFRVLENAQLALAAPQNWSQIQLDREERLAFADAARTLRFGDEEGNVTTPITAGQFLNARRQDDVGSDLWRTFNVVQENAIRGGLSAVGRDAQNRRQRRTTSRQINGIDQDVKLNRALFTLAARMAELKAR